MGWILLRLSAVISCMLNKLLTSGAGQPTAPAARANRRQQTYQTPPPGSFPINLPQEMAFAGEQHV